MNTAKKVGSWCALVGIGIISRDRFNRVRWPGAECHELTCPPVLLSPNSLFHPNSYQEGLRMCWQMIERFKDRFPSAMKCMA